jgi:hypothetical protein
VDLLSVFIPICSSIGGALLGASTVRHFGIKERRRKLCWDLNRKFHDVEFRYVRKSVWETMNNAKNDWDYVEKNIMPFFLKLNTYPDEKPDTIKELSPRQNLSIILYFWSEIYMGIEDDFIDKDLTKKLFGHFYSLYDEFFERFLTEYETKDKKPEINPLWVNAIPFLRRFFQNKNSQP